MCGEIVVVNVRGLRANAVNVWYVGRACAGWHASPLGNPFHLGGRTRGSTLAAYKAWLWGKVQSGRGPAWAALANLAALVKSGQRVQLGCWCVPGPCHGEIVKACVLWLVANNKA